MCILNIVDQKNMNFICAGVTTFLATSAITLLVAGILGISGSIILPQLASYCMIGVGSAVILGMIGGIVGRCCSKDDKGDQ
ncbi:MAG: hypothetical protein R3E91_01060 [Chlamydiales bacterium]